MIKKVSPYASIMISNINEAVSLTPMLRTDSKYSATFNKLKNADS